MRYTRIEVYEGPNDAGEYSHMRFWMADYHPGHPEGEHAVRERGQCFLSRIPEGGWPIIDKRFDRRKRAPAMPAPASRRIR